jgi:hypothetical protein
MKNVIQLWFFIALCLIPHNVVFSQTVTKTTITPVSNTVCPGVSTYYEVSVPSGFTACQISWSVTNGTRVVNPNDQRKVTVTWNDTPGAIGTITATFSSCGSGNEANNGVTATKSELILSVNNQSWGSYGNTVSVDYCSNQQKIITVPKMYVQGTGGIAQPPLIEVHYYWTLPSGWREVGTNRTGSFGTPVNSVVIQPVACATRGNVTVQGVLNDASFCPFANPSATATILLNSTNVNVNILPQSGYGGGSACNTTPVTFYANAPVGCVSSYTWAFPTSWTEIGRSGNSITLRPSGTPADSNPMKVTVNFSCGSSVESGNYVPPLHISCCNWTKLGL